MTPIVEWTAFAQFMERVHEAKEHLNLKRDQDVFYRGLSKSSHRLLPSLFRQKNNDVWQLECRTFFQFRALARELYASDRPDWDILFHMQHHGVPTRLLDWTSVFGVALYFALIGFEPDSGYAPCIWLMNPYRLNQAQWKTSTETLFHPKYLARDELNNRSYDYGELLVRAHMGPESQAYHKGWRTLPWERPMAIYDNQRSDRMYAQHGWFTIHGTDERSIDEIFPDTPGILQKIEIPPAAIPASQQFLLLSGIGHRQLFPGLDGLAKTVNERFDLLRSKTS